MTGTYRVWPDHPYWSYWVTWAIGMVDFGGADFTEINEVCQRMVPADAESWYQEWLHMGHLVEERARTAEARGNWVTARNAYQRCCTYYRQAQAFLTGEDERKVRTLEKMRDMFDAAITYFEPRPEYIEIPYEGQPLPGYFFPPKDAPGTAPTILFLLGGDSTPSDAYFAVGKTLTEAGYGFLVYDQPGAGLTLYQKGIPSTPESERFVTPIVDYLQSRSDVDVDRLILIGWSLGGYLVPRAAAFERRLAAAVALSPVYKIDLPALAPIMPPVTRSHAMHLLGAKTEAEAVARASQFTLAGVVDKIACPLLLIQSPEDLLLPNPVNETLRVYEEAGSNVKKMVIIERDAGLGGVEHCQADNFHVAHEAILNWLIDIGLGTGTGARFQLP